MLKIEDLLDKSPYELGKMLLNKKILKNSKDVQLIMSLDPILDIKDENHRWTALYIALKNDYSDAFNILITAGASLDIFVNGQTALHVAADNGSLKVCKILIENGAQVNTQDMFGRTPLQYAALDGHLGVCKVLIDAGGDVNHQDEYGLTPLHWAAKEGHLDVCNLLIAMGAQVDAQLEETDDNEGGTDYWTPLNFAVYHEHPDVCKLLIAAGADVNDRDTDGWDRSPLQLAVEMTENLEICKILITAGAEVNVGDSNGMTPLDHAVENGQVEMCKLLIAAGARLDDVDHTGQTLWDSAKPALRAKLPELNPNKKKKNA